MATRGKTKTVQQELDAALAQHRDLEAKIQELKRASRDAVLEQIRLHIKTYDITHAELQGYLTDRAKGGHRGAGARPRVSGARASTGKRATAKKG